MKPNNQPRRRTRDLVKVAARELAVTLRSGLWPLARLHPLPRSTPQPGRPPVVMVHGYMGHAEMLRPLTRTLLEHGWGDVRRVGYPSLWWRFERIIEEIANTVDDAAAAADGPVDLVGHSLGAVACRAWIKLGDGRHKVRRFVSLGGPHAGTSLHRIVPSPVRPVFHPQGSWVRRLAEGPEPVPTTVIRARYDHQVLPPHRASIPGVVEHVVEAHGHNGLLWSAEAHERVMAALLAPSDPL